MKTLHRALNGQIFTLLKLSQVGHSRNTTIILAGKLGVIWLYEALFKKQQKALAPQNQVCRD